MNPPATSAALVYNIAAAERDTGLSKDTLRVWERRYGFPKPTRDGAGERIYSSQEIEQLRVLKRLVDAGERPGRLMALTRAELMERLQRHAPMAVSDVPQVVDDYLEILKSHDVQGLRRQLVHARERLGLARFVTDVVGPLNTRVGDAWMRGQLQIFEEHLYTESMQVILRVNNWHGVTNLTQYTWGKSLDDASDGIDFNFASAALPQDSLNLRAEKGPSTYDTRGRFSTAVNSLKTRATWNVRPNLLKSFTYADPSAV